MGLMVISQLLEIIVYGQPVPQPRQRHRVMKLPDGSLTSGNYLPKKHDVWRFKRAVRDAVKTAMQGRPPVEGELRLHLTFHVRRPQGSVKPEYYPPSDVDNYAKSVLDACNGILYVDDKQVTQLWAEKVVCRKLPNRSIEVPHTELAVLTIKRPQAERSK
jgi:Holliday junction resolvase RusA-like endonuclease